MKEQSKDLRAITEEKVQWTTFESYSAADYHWKDLFRMFTGNDHLPSIKKRAELARKHPMFCNDFFRAKWKDFFTRLKNLYGITDYYIRFESHYYRLVRVFILTVCSNLKMILGL